MLANIPLPPAPPVMPLYIVSGVCILLGAALLLWGRSSGRVFLTFAAAGAGAACAQTITSLTNFPYVWIVGAVSALTAGLLVFLFIRLLWALILSALVGIVALVIVQWPGIAKLAAPPDWTSNSLASFGDWVFAIAHYYADWIVALVQGSLLPLLLMVALPMFVILLVALLLPKAATILASSLVGSVCIIAGAVGLIWAVRPPWFSTATEQIKVLGIIAGVLVLMGLVLQGRSEFKAIAKAKEKEAEKKKEQAAPAGEAKQAKK